MKPYSDLILQKGISLFKKRNRRPRQSTCLILLFLLLLLPACANKQLRLAIETSSKLNQQDSGSALPLIVRVYQLKNKDRIEQADFKSLWKSDKETLGDDLVDLREFTLHPNTKKLIEIDRIDKANYFAIMGLFRKPDDQNGWRKIRVLKGWGLTKRLIQVEAHEQGIEILEE